LYLYLGSSSVIPRLEATATGPEAVPHPGQGGEMPPLDVLVQRLADKLEQNPDNLDGWVMLGRSYLAIGQPGRALYAIEKAFGLGPDNPDVLVAYAEALATNNDSELAGRPAKLIQSALKIDPEHTRARWLQGLMYFQKAEYMQAAGQWEALIAAFGPQSEEAAELRRYVAEARNRAGVETTGREAETIGGVTSEQGSPPATATDAPLAAERSASPPATG